MVNAMRKTKQAYSFSKITLAKYHKLGSLNQQNSPLSSPWRLEVCGQDIIRAMLPLKSLETDPCPFLASGDYWKSLVILGSQMEYSKLCPIALSLNICVSVSLFYKGHQTLDLVPTLIQYGFT
jgi:hypothetical protein